MSAQQKILLVQLYANGDCLYATAIARQIKTDFPGCRLTWAIAPFCKSILSGNPYVDEVSVCNEVKKDDVAAFRKYVKKVFSEKALGIWDEVFVTTTMDTNLANYDGTIRGMIIRGYPHKMTVPLEPVLTLTDAERSTVAAFAEKHGLRKFKHVILWEYAPQSGQSSLTADLVKTVADRLTALPSVCIILTSGNKFPETDPIIDASVLSVRENAALTHYCNLLIGCSSGITWISTSSAAKFLPMVQLLNARADFRNAPSEDFKRYHIKHKGLIEMSEFAVDTIFNCVAEIIKNGFDSAMKYHEKLPLQFNTTKKIVYNLLVYREFSAIRKHYRIMTGIYGRHPLLLKAFAAGFAGFPFKLVNNLWRRKFNPGIFSTKKA
ncbi:MAG: hypothetical protein WKF88_04220 [Ferruginibacter sp.]